jgi:hypothetical protein
MRDSREATRLDLPSLSLRSPTHTLCGPLRPHRAHRDLGIRLGSATWYFLVGRWSEAGPSPWRVPVGGSPILTMSVAGRRDPGGVAVARECLAALARARVVIVDAGPARGVNRQGGGSVLRPESGWRTDHDARRGGEEPRGVGVA